MFLPLVRDHRTINIVCCSGHSSIWCWQSPLKGWGQSLSCSKQRSDFYFLWEKNSFNSDELAIKLLRSLAHGLKRDPNNFPENSWFAQTIKDLRRKFQICMRNKQIRFCSADCLDKNSNIFKTSGMLSHEKITELMGIAWLPKSIERPF